MDYSLRVRRCSQRGMRRTARLLRTIICPRRFPLSSTHISPPLPIMHSDHTVPPVLKREFNVVLLGGALVGKSALLHRVLLSTVHGTATPTLTSILQFLDPHATWKDIDKDCTLPSISNPSKDVVTHGGETCTLHLYDTAGADDTLYNSHDQEIRDGDGFIIVFTLSTSNSFQTALAYLNQVQRQKPGAPAVLYHSKMDEWDEQRFETPPIPASAAFYEGSSLRNVEHPFEHLANQLSHRPAKFDLQSKATMRLPAGGEDTFSRPPARSPRLLPQRSFYALRLSPISSTSSQNTWLRD